jgi:hypothetical protein
MASGNTLLVRNFVFNLLAVAQLNSVSGIQNSTKLKHTTSDVTTQAPCLLTPVASAAQNASHAVAFLLI